MAGHNSNGSAITLHLFSMTDEQAVWTESDSRDFIDLADVAVPGRREQMEMLLSLVPAPPEETFVAAEIGCGEGLLAEQLLDRFPLARLVAFDGSEVMLAKARARIDRFGERVELHRAHLATSDWFAELPASLRCVLSSLAVHHLSDAAKRDLFRQLADRLEPGGALLLADVVAPVNDVVRRSCAAAWDTIARAQSLQITGSLDPYQRAVAEGWNPPASNEPVPGEMPARLFDQLKWLEEAGLSQVDCFWLRAGVAIYGGYR